MNQVAKEETKTTVQPPKNTLTTDLLRLPGDAAGWTTALLELPASVRPKSVCVFDFGGPASQTNKQLAAIAAERHKHGVTIICQDVVGTHLKETGVPHINANQSSHNATRDYVSTRHAAAVFQQELNPDSNVAEVLAFGPDLAMARPLPRPQRMRPPNSNIS